MTYSNIRKNIITSIAIGVAFVLAITVNPLCAQVFPVQANINVTPPYTVYLSHYTAPDQQRVMASVLLHDPVVTSLDVRFRFTIEGAGIRIYTNPGWIPAPFMLRSGITELIPADIIAEYFRPQNVIAEGINPQELFRKGKLPEGFYQFKIEVLEYQRGVPISNIGRTGVWLLLSEPPRVVFPTPNQKVNATNPQILNFTWVSGGVTSPLSAMSTMYEFTLVELMGEVDPTVAITTASDAIKFTRTQQQTTLLYGPGDPQLIPGKRYAYRVRAYNTDGYELFKNNGYSEVRVFQFGDACNAPTMFSLKDETQSTFSIDVVSDPSSTAWQAQFRESGDEAGQWSELKAEPGTSTKTVKGLKASTTYQVQLKSLCGTVSSSYTTPQTITTKEKVNTQRSCENSVSPFVVSQAEPLQQLKPNDIFLAALMPIKVTEVTSQGGGKFSGKGIATVPLFSAGLAVHFTDIGINELMQLTAGEVVVERNAVNVNLFGDTDPTGNGSTTGNGTATDTTGNDGWPEFTDTINISSEIDSVVVVNDTTVWVYTSGGGEPVIVDMGGSDCLLIVPADGNMDNAQVVYNGAAKPYSAGSGSTSDTDEQYTGFRARFAPALNTQYGFDSLRVQAYANQYNDLEIDGKTYKLPWKALPVNIPDPVTLHIRRSADSYPYSDLKVGVLGGNDLLPTAGANTATQTYNLTGTNDGDQYAVVATYDQDGKRKYAGGLWAATYQKKEHKLYIVPLPGVEVPAATIGQLQNGLTQIYSQAVVSWDVQPLNGFTGVELGDNGLDWADKDMLSSYNAEMNSVISEFKNWKADADPDAYYLFVVPQFSEGGLEGFMPRNRRFGFVTLSQLDARLVAHEIGHGAFNLRHTFPEVPQGSTDNLMDYSDGQTALLKPQWDLIHNPETTTGLFDDMEDGASVTDAFAKYVLKIYSPYISEKIVFSNDVNSKVELIKSRLKDSFTKEQVDYINSNKLSNNNLCGYFEIPKGNPIATMTVNKTGQGVIMYLVEKNSDGKFVMNRYTSGTHTDIIKKKLSKLKEFDINVDIFTPTDMLLGAGRFAAIFWDGVIKFGGTIEVKGGVGYGGAGSFSFGHAIDRSGNLAVYGSISGFLSMCEALTVAGHANAAAGENMYILGGASVTADLGFTKYKHVYELSGIVNIYDFDASVVDVSIEVNKYLEFRGITLSRGYGFGVGFGTFSSKSAVWAYTKKDVLNAVNAFDKMKLIYEEHKKLGRTANIIPNIYANGIRIKSMEELFEGNFNDVYYSFDIFDPDEDDFINAKPIESIILVKFIKPDSSKPYFRTINVTKEPQ